jgi:hypothetical protein
LNPEQGSVSVLFGDGVGGFYSPSAISAPDSLSDIATADFNGDGRPDIVISDSVSEQIFLYLR